MEVGRLSTPRLKKRQSLYINAVLLVLKQYVVVKLGFNMTRHLSILNSIQSYVSFKKKKILSGVLLEWHRINISE